MFSGLVSASCRYIWDSRWCNGFDHHFRIRISHKDLKSKPSKKFQNVIRKYESCRATYPSFSGLWDAVIVFLSNEPHLTGIHIQSLYQTSQDSQQQQHRPPQPLHNYTHIHKRQNLNHNPIIRVASISYLHQLKVHRLKSEGQMTKKRFVLKDEIGNKSSLAEFHGVQSILQDTLFTPDEMKQQISDKSVSQSISTVPISSLYVERRTTTEQLIFFILISMKAVSVVILIAIHIRLSQCSAERVCPCLSPCPCLPNTS
jgi:hypothetical protein